MNYTRYYTLLFATLITLSGCGTQNQISMSTTTINIPTSTTSTPAAANTQDLLPISNFEAKNLPAEIQPGQIGPAFSDGKNTYLFIEQPNLNYPLNNIVKDTISFAGILHSQDNGKSWRIFFSIPEVIKVSKRPFNPISIFIKDNRLWVDLVDDNGAGSGEGVMARFSYNEQKWVKQNCYYFIPENYYTNGMPDNQKETLNLKITKCDF